MSFAGLQAHPYASANGAAEALDEGEAGVRTFVVYPQRWLVLAIYCMLAMASAVIWLTFAPAAQQFSLYFNKIGTTAINMLSLIFLIIYPFGTLLGAYISTRYGLRACVLSAGMLSLAACAVRWLAVLLFDRSFMNATSAYILVFVGQFLGALAQPLLFNSPGIIASQWFAFEERDSATTIGALFDPFGNAVASVLTPSLVSQQSQDDDSAVHGVQTLMLTELIMIAIPVVASIVFFKDSPPTPPSLSSAKREEKNSHPSAREAMIQLRSELYELLRNRDFVIVLVVFSVGLGYFNAMLTLVQQILGPYGYSSSDCGLLGATLIVVGLFGAGVTGYLLDKTHAYRTSLLVAWFGAYVSVVSFLFCIVQNNFIGLAIIFGFMGLFMLSVLPSALQNSAEVTYPIHEDKSNGLLFTGGQLLGVPYTFVLGALCNEKKWWGPFSGLFVATLVPVTIASAALLFYKKNYKRVRAERNGQSEIALDLQAG